MATLNTLQGDLKVTGQIIPGTLTIPAGSLTDAGVNAAAAIQATKLESDQRITYCQEAGTNAVAETRTIFVARGAGRVVDFDVGLITPPNTAEGSSGRTITFDLKKNGTTVLSATVKLNSTAVAYATSAGAISSANYVAGDVFTVTTTIAGSVGTYPLGSFAHACFREVAV